MVLQKLKIETDIEKIAEGGMFPVKLSSSPPPETGQDITVVFGNSNSSSYFDSFSSASPITLTSANPEKNYHGQPPNNVAGATGDGSIVVTLTSATSSATPSPMIDSENSSVTVKVLDNDTPRPTISVTAGSGASVDEGTDFSFNIMSNQNAPTDGLKINYIISPNW